MEYLRITQKRNIRNVLLPQLPSSTEIWGKREPLFIPSFAEEPEGEAVFLPFYEGNAFLISGPMQAIWEDYQRGGRYRPCAFGSVEKRKILPYCLAMPRILECTHADTLYYKNGAVQKLILDKAEIGANKVFGVRTLRSIMLILSEDVLEEMLRGNMTGFQWETVSAR